MNSKSKQALDAFGRAVVTEVYDRALSYLQARMTRGMKGNNPDPLQQAYQKLDPTAAETVREFCLDAVDQTFAQFLSFFEVHEISLLFPAEDGEPRNITAASDGLPAEPYSDNGWIAQYSKFKHGWPNS